MTGTAKRSQPAARFAVVACAALTLALGACSVATAAPTVSWAINAVAEPTHFSSDDAIRCEAEGPTCDKYQILVANVGDAPSSGAVTLSDLLPPGLVVREVRFGKPTTGSGWSCEEGTALVCTLDESIPPGRYAPFIEIRVTAPTPEMEAAYLATKIPLENEVKLEGGGGTGVTSASQETPIDPQDPSFALTQFDVSPEALDAAPELGAGAHPWQITMRLATPLLFKSLSNTNAEAFVPVEQIKSVGVELPTGLIGNPLATVRCSEAELRSSECPPASSVGAMAVLIAGNENGEYEYTGEPIAEPTSAIYNMVPSKGFAGVFGVNYDHQTILLYTSLVHAPSGYRVRITAPGIPTEPQTAAVSLTLFGEPGKLNGSGSEAAFLTDPATCAPGPLSSRVEVASWENPGHPVGGEAHVFSAGRAGCSRLQFHPSLYFAPSSADEEGTTQADTPSAYTFDLQIPQTSAFGELATPPLENATVVLPEGVSVNPSAASGLVGCQAEGPEGINIGSAEIGAGGRDEGDPEATELGAGHAGGNGSPYDDGFYHTARGHCPAASTLGTAEAISPLLEAPLTGHLYLAQPSCGGGDQPPCTQASATNGELFGLYLELGGEPDERSGVIVKLAGSVAVNPTTGQITSTFKQNPQLPVERLKLHVRGGPRAPLANPQTCGMLSMTSDLVPWSTPATPDATPSSPFTIAGCPGTMPFAPSFLAGTLNPAAGSSSPFTLTFSRRDGEQDVSALSMTLPPGLVGMISQVPLCAGPQAASGACPEASRIGSATAVAGAGSQPISLGGRVYLTGPYNGAPFGISIVVQAQAGPFDFGNVVVNLALSVDPNSSAVTATSGPIPQIMDGVPFRLRSVNVNLDRPGFILNPTNCRQQSITGTLAAAQGATASVSTPFAASGCAGLPFRPNLTARTQGNTSKADGASLRVKVVRRVGEANIRKLELQLPPALSSRLTTLQRACTAAQFSANPAGCPAGSVIGRATAVTPLLNVPLTGPAYLVSHGGVAFPDAEFVLQGQGVTVMLDGKTEIDKGVTYSKFETIPDAPISSFETVLPEGPHSILGAVGTLCRPTRTVKVKRRVAVRRHGRTKYVLRSLAKRVPAPLAMGATITAQSGKVITQRAKIAVSDCPKTVTGVKKARKAKRTAHRRKTRRGAR